MSVVDDIKEWSRENPEVIVGAVILAVISFRLALLWRELITDYRFTLQLVLTTVMAVLIVEAITVTDPKGLMDGLYGYGKTEAQAVILVGLIFTALFSNLFIRWLENTLEQGTLIRLLGLLAITSRLYVNFSASSSSSIGRKRDSDAPLGILDGQRDTYAVYIFGLTAIISPYIVQFISQFTNLVRAIGVSPIAFGTAVFASVGYYAFCWWRDNYSS